MLRLENLYMEVNILPSHWSYKQVISGWSYCDRDTIHSFTELFVFISSFHTSLTNSCALVFAVASSLNWQLFGHVSSYLSDARLRLWRQTQWNEHVKRNVPNQAELLTLTGNSWLAPWADDVPLIDAFSTLTAVKWDHAESLKKHSVFLTTFTFHLPLKDFSDVKCTSRVTSGSSLATSYRLTASSGQRNAVFVAWCFCPYCIS